MSEMIDPEWADFASPTIRGRHLTNIARLYGIPRRFLERDASVARRVMAAITGQPYPGPLERLWLLVEAMAG